VGEPLKRNVGWPSQGSIIAAQFEKGYVWMSWCTVRSNVLASVALGATILLSPQLGSAQVQITQKETSDTECGCSAIPVSQIPCLISMVEETLTAKIIEKPEAIYPTEAKTAHFSGEVSVGVIIDKNGRIIFAWLEAGHAALSGAALNAAYKVRVKPTRLSGSAVYVKSVVTYRFG
jgi:hypothetical protein